MKKVLINSILNYYKDNVLYIEENCNIINHLLKVSYKLQNNIILYK